MAEGMDPDLELSAERAGFFYTDDDGVGFLTEEERRDYELAKQLEEEDRRLDREREEQAQMDRAIAESLRTDQAVGIDLQNELQEQMQLEEVLQRSMADPDSPLGNFRGPDLPSLPGGVDINTAQAILTALGANTTNQLLGTDSADGINNNEDSPMLGSVRRELRLQEEVRLRSQGAPWGQGSSSEAEGDAERERRMQTEWEREEAEEDMILSQVLSQQRPQAANTGSAAGRLERPINTDGGLEDNMIVQEATASSSVDQLVPNRRRSVEIEDDIADELRMDGAQGSSSQGNISASTSGSQRRRSVDMEEDVAEEVRIAMGAASNNSTNVSSSQPQFGAAASCSTGVTRSFPSAGAMMPYPVDPNYDEELPCNWTLGLDREQICHHIRLLTTSEEYRLIAEEFSRVNITVECIDRVQNQRLWDRLQYEKHHLKDMRRSNSFDVNEQYLFHGTQSSAINQICEEGLDQRLSRIGNFGRGIYFSDDPRKCVDYSASNRDQDSNPCILKCRVLLGDVKVYPHGQTDKDLRREPLRENREEGMPKSYDSVQGCVREYNEFVIYSSYRTIPEYIIYYRVPGTASRTTQGNAQAQTGVPSTSASATFSRSQSVSSDTHPEMEDESEEMGAAPTAARTEDEHPEVRRGSNSSDNPVAMATGSGVPPAASGGTGQGLDPHEERIRRVRAIVQAERRAEAEARQRRLEASAQSRRDRAAQAEQQGQGAQPSDLAVSSEPPKEVVDEHEAKLLRVRKIVQDRRKLEKLMKSAGKESDIDALMKVYDETYGQAPQGTTSDSDDPVTIVMAFLIPDFLEVTGTDLDTAKSFLRQANMDLQKAIDLYFRCQ